MLNSRLFRLQQNQIRHFSTVLIRTNWYTISCKYSDYCQEIRSYIRNPSKCELTSESFVYAISRLYVPKGTTSLYETCENWKEFFSITEMDD